MTIDLQGKSALVTGGARGIGRASALALAEAGCQVVISDLAVKDTGLDYDSSTRDTLEQAAAELSEQTGSSVAAAPADVRSFAQLSDAVAVAVQQHGGLDFVVANAGVASWPQATWKATEEQWRMMIDVVLTGTWNTVRAAVPAILETGRGGSIVFMGSTAAVRPLPTIGHYAAAKSGLVGLMKSLALELAGDSIRVNIVHPGGTGTEMTENAAAEHWQATAQGVAGTLSLPMPIHRMESIDVGHAVRWLCSAESRYMTGTQMILDAGATL